MYAVKMTALIGLSAQLLLVHPSNAADYPSRPIKLLVGASAGGTTDAMARTIAEPLSSLFAKPVLVENRPGAGGNLAAEAVSGSKSAGTNRFGQVRPRRAHNGDRRHWLVTPSCRGPIQDDGRCEYCECTLQGNSAGAHGCIGWASGSDVHQPRHRYRSGAGGKFTRLWGHERGAATVVSGASGDWRNRYGLRVGGLVRCVRAGEASRRDC